MADLEPGTSGERIDLANEGEFELGRLTVRPSELLVLSNGDRRELQPRVMQVLVALAQSRPAVVSRDKLIEQCWDGRIVGDDALNRCILALRHLSQEFAPQPFHIETVPRIGHRLVENGAGSEAVPRRTWRKRWRAVAAAVILLVISAAGLLLWQQRVQASEPASIAVLPFRNLSSGEPYFAEGIGEEIMGQLAREPAFRVAGSASAAQFSGPADPRKVGRALGVDYILEGSVRPDADRVRINASLIETKDGVRLWSETYDRRLDDILEVQSAIGQAVATGLRRELVHPAPDIRPVKGEAYVLYLNARGLLRSDNPQSGQDAVALLREAIRIDPDFAPAWASLADALVLDARTKGNEGLTAVLPQAYVAARHALQLDPNVAEAHGVLAEILGSESDEAIAHLRRAAALDPRSGQGLIWLGTADASSGKFEKGTADDRRAHELDPAWPFPQRALIDDLAASGYRSAAEAAIRDAFPDDPMVQNFAMGRVARLLGDFSEAARRWSLVANSESRWAAPSKRGLDTLLFALDLTKVAPEPTAGALIGGSRFVAAPPMRSAPSPSEWRQHTRSLAAALVYADDNALAAKRMLLAGRSRELVATYDGATGLLRIRKGQSVGALRVRDAPIVALALRQQGRLADADDLLRRSDATVRAVYANGTVPVFFDEDAAGVWAAQGKTDIAIDALERAFRRGWLHVGHTDFASLQDEPAFRSLRGNPRFDALVAKHAAHYSRERREIAQALHMRS